MIGLVVLCSVCALGITAWAWSMTRTAPALPVFRPVSNPVITIYCGRCDKKLGSVPQSESRLVFLDHFAAEHENVKPTQPSAEA